MRVTVEFGAERLEFEVPPERVVGVWRGPEPVPAAAVKPMVAAALEQPLEYPPLRQAVVPGDRVAIAFDLDVPEPSRVLEAVCESLYQGGVEDETIQVVSTAPPGEWWHESNLRGIEWQVHDPNDRSQLAYLASTKQGHRVYLNRTITDADCVVPVGRLAYDAAQGYRGPWSAVFPALSDAESVRSVRAQATEAVPDRTHLGRALAESADVNWLLGSQLQLGLVAGVAGLARAIAGQHDAMRQAGLKALDEAWAYRAPSWAELVVVGIGQPGKPGQVAELADGLATAARLVRSGGKIVALSRAQGSFGPALERLLGADRERSAVQLLRGAEGDVDYPAARQIARALASADVYLLSSLNSEQVDDLGMIVLDRPEEARRLVGASTSCLFVSQGELTRAEVWET